MYRTGIVSAVDVGTHRVKVRFPAYDNVESGWLPVTTRGSHGEKDFGLYSLDTQVGVVLDDRAEDGLVLGAIYSNADPPTAPDEAIRRFEFGDGGLVEYSRTTHTLRIVIPAGGHLDLAGAAEPIALAGLVLAQLNAIQSALDSHTHQAGLLMAPPGGGPCTGMSGTASSGYSPAAVASGQVRSA